MQIQSKLPKSDITIFTIMSALAAKHKAINLGQGFPDFDCDEKLRHRVAKYLNAEKNQYCPMPGLLHLRQAIAEKIQYSHGVNVNPETEICVTAGATQALFTAITAFVHEGEEVIILEPAYDSYIPSIQIAGGIPKGYQMKYPDYAIDWNAIEDMVTDKTRMIIINTPHNPTGTILKQEDLEALEQIVANKDIIVLSDEVYEHLIYDDEIHQSVIRFPNLYQQSLAVFSFGKTFHSTGWKMGYCVGPKHLMDEFKNVHQWNVFCVNSFTQFALAEHLQEPENYTTLPDFFEQKRDYLTESLADIPLRPKLSKGTFFQLFNYEELSDQTDAEFAKYLTKEIGVAAIPLSPFYSKPTGDKVIRLCFAKKESTLSEAAERLSKLAS
ncbi:MAG: methionine aminotransferase [Bacteroidota bacterium]